MASNSEISALQSSISIPDQIRVAARLGRLVVFVGAGVSALCGSPLWGRFADAMVEELVSLIGLSYIEKEQIKAITDPRKKASIAADLAGTKAFDFKRILHPAQETAGAEAYRFLAEMNPVFITTNYDTWLDHLPINPSAPTPLTASEIDVTRTGKPRSVYSEPGDFTIEKLSERGAVIHLHGSCQKPSSMVLSLRDYIDFYSRDDTRNFLTEVFENYNVLFVGYGLAEIELLEHIVRYAPQSTLKAGVPPNHYILYPYLSTEETQLRFITQYFLNQCGIGVVPYNIDSNGYPTLVSVLSNWRAQIDVRPKSFLEEQSDIDRLLVRENERSVRGAVIAKISANSDLADYFFSKVQHPVWLVDLRNAGFFEPRNNIPPERGDDEPYYRARPWMALQFLEKVASSLADSDITVSNALREIVKEVTRDAKARNVQNWLTWGSLARIFSHIPARHIDLADIELASTWIELSFGIAAVADALTSELLPRLLASPHVDDAEKAALLTQALLAVREQQPNE